MTWTPERVEQLRTLWPQVSLSYAEIARQIGGITRSAVAGKARRLGLPMLAKKPPKEPAPPKSKNPKPPRQTITRITNHGNRFDRVTVNRPRPLPVDIPAADIPLEQRKQLLELGPRDCRFAYGHVGEPGFFFCSARKVSGSSYCKTHKRLCEVA